MENTKLTVLEKDGSSYVEIGYYKSYLINDKPLQLCPGNEKWAFIDSTITSIKRPHTLPTKIIGYKLKSKYSNLVDMPEELPAESFDVDCDGSLYGEYNEFYEAMRTTPEIKYTDIEFQVIDLNCEPINLPEYVQIKFPDNLRNYPQTWHKYPCYISASKVFDILYDKVVNIVDSSDKKYGRDNYKNIQTLEVWENVPVNFPLHKRIIEYATTKKGKNKVKNIQETIRKIRVFRLYGTYKLDREIDSDTEILIQSISGENYQHLQKNLEDYIQSFIILLDSKKREVCPHCKGTGISVECKQ